MLYYTVYRIAATVCCIVSNENMLCELNHSLNIKRFSFSTPGRMIHERCWLCCPIYAISDNTRRRVHVPTLLKPHQLVFCLRISYNTDPAPHILYSAKLRSTRWDAPADVTCWHLATSHLKVYTVYQQRIVDSHADASYIYTAGAPLIVT